MDLTKRQQEIFDFIRKYSAKYGYPPTVRDIGKAVGLASSSTMHEHLANLEKLGLLRRDPTKPRAMELLDRAGAAVRQAGRPGLPPLWPGAGAGAAAAPPRAASAGPVCRRYADPRRGERGGVHRDTVGLRRRRR